MRANPIEYFVHWWHSEGPWVESGKVDIWTRNDLMRRKWEERRSCSSSWEKLGLHIPFRETTQRSFFFCAWRTRAFPVPKAPAPHACRRSCSSAESRPGQTPDSACPGRRSHDDALPNQTAAATSEGVERLRLPHLLMTFTCALLPYDWSATGL